MVRRLDKIRQSFNIDCTEMRHIVAMKLRKVHVSAAQPSTSRPVDAAVLQRAEPDLLGQTETTPSRVSAVLLAKCVQRNDGGSV